MHSLAQDRSSVNSPGPRNAVAANRLEDGFIATPAKLFLDPELATEPTAIRLFAVLCSGANGTGIYTRPISDAADRLGVSRGDVVRAIRRLREAGWIETVTRDRLRLRPAKGLPDDDLRRQRVT